MYRYNHNDVIGWFQKWPWKSFNRRRAVLDESSVTRRLDGMTQYEQSLFNKHFTIRWAIMLRYICNLCQKNLHATITDTAGTDFSVHRPRSISKYFYKVYAVSLYGGLTICNCIYDTISFFIILLYLTFHRKGLDTRENLYCNGPAACKDWNKANCNKYGIVHLYIMNIKRQRFTKMHEYFEYKVVNEN